MNLSDKVIKNLLKEKGYLEFKSFVAPNGKENVYCYYTDKIPRILHFCDANLQEIDRNDLGIDKGALFILSTDKKYSLLPENIEVRSNDDDSDEFETQKGWLVNENNEIINFYIKGYFKISDRYYALGSPRINISDDFVCGFWEQSMSNPHPYTREYTVWDREIEGLFIGGSKQCSYLGTIENIHILSNKENGIFIIKENGDIVDSNIRGLIRVGNSLNSVKIEADKKCIRLRDLLTLSEVSLALPREDKYSNYNSSSFFCSNHDIICVFRRYISKYSDEADEYMYEFGEYEDYLEVNAWYAIYENFEQKYHGNFPVKNNIIKFENNIVITEHSYEERKEWWMLREKKRIFNFRDYEMNILGTAPTLNDEYFVLKRVISSNAPDKKDLYGLLRLSEMQLALPIRYDSIEVIKVPNNSTFYAILGILNLTVSPDKYVYGLFQDNRITVPVKFDQVALLGSFHKKAVFIVNKDCKFGFMYESTYFSEVRYDEIQMKQDYILLKANERVGVYIPATNSIVANSFFEIKAVAQNSFIGDDSLYYIDGDNYSKLMDLKGFRYLDQSESSYVFKVEEEKNDYGIGDYVCVYINSKGEIFVIDSVNCEADDSELSEYSLKHYDLLLFDDLYFDLRSEKFTELDDLIEEDDWYEEDTNDYERDTFYALGGDDYDEWKNNGGDVDDMMDALGY
ncbi:MAG: hypothetical protein K2N35_11385 [Muribaculaceae bacterium]|nr:hypothetical protein [Muribaculaceae bacterium]